MELDEQTRGIMRSLITMAGKSKAEAAQAASKAQADDRNVLSYFHQVCKQHGVDPEKYGLTEDMSQLVEKPTGELKAVK